MPALVLLVAFAVWYFAGRALRPVELIRLQAASITGSTIHRRVPEPGTDDEVGRLAHTMNAMLGSARAVVATPAAVRERRVARAAQPARVDPRQPRSRAAQLRPRRLARGRAPRCSRKTSAWKTP